MNHDRTFTSSPFVSAIEPISESDDEIRDYLAAAELPPLLPALAYATGDLSLLRDDLRPDPMMFSAAPQGGLSDEQQDAVRELAFGVLHALPRHRARRRHRPPTSNCSTSWSSASAGPRCATYLPLLEEELAYRGEDRRAPGWQLADVAPGRRLRSPDHRRRNVGPPRRTPFAAGRREVRDRRQERRRRRHVVREQVSGLSRRQPEPQLQLRVRTAARLAAALLDPRRAARLLPALRRHLRAARPHPLLDGGALEPPGRKPTSSGTVRVRTPDGARGDDRRRTR